MLRLRCDVQIAVVLNDRSRVVILSQNRGEQLMKFDLFNRLRGAAFSSDTFKTMDTTYLEIPVYNVDKPQTLETRKARLHYQSRKRGMLENDLILSTFAKKYLDKFSEEQTMMYDRLINSPSNDWDIFHWVVEKKPTPKEFDNEIMDMLKKHAKNDDKTALRQPNLY